MKYNQIIDFHGHNCPGLAVGFRMTKAALDFLAQSRSEDEELVAIVENDACGIDALQCLSGCTFGKGNLLFRDYGKHVYTLFSRHTGKGVRVSYDKSKVPESCCEDRENLIDWLLSEAGGDAISLREVSTHVPKRAQIRSSVNCDFCGENVMEIRIKKINGKCACIPCAEEIKKAP